MALTQFNWNRTLNGTSPDWDAILDERNFQKILILERKRSERSGNPFVLVSVDINRLLGETKQLDPVLRDAIFASLLLVISIPLHIRHYPRGFLEGRKHDAGRCFGNLSVATNALDQLF